MASGSGTSRRSRSSITCSILGTHSDNRSPQNPACGQPYDFRQCLWITPIRAVFGAGWCAKLLPPQEVAMPRLSGRLASSVVLACLLAGCQPPAPSPTPVPSYRCTPEAGGAEFDCTQHQYDEMVAKDKLYAEAEAVYRKFLAEDVRILRAGGIDAADAGTARNHRGRVSRRRPWTTTASLTDGRHEARRRRRSARCRSVESAAEFEGRLRCSTARLR